MWYLPVLVGWPSVNSHYGNIDIAGFPKDFFWYYQSVWRTEPMAHILPHWDWNTTTCKRHPRCSLRGSTPQVDVW
jgi:hypothetical protein